MILWIVTQGVSFTVVNIILCPFFCPFPIHMDNVLISYGVGDVLVYCTAISKLCYVLFLS